MFIESQWAKDSLSPIENTSLLIKHDIIPSLCNNYNLSPIENIHLTISLDKICISFFKQFRPRVTQFLLSLGFSKHSKDIYIRNKEKIEIIYYKPVDLRNKKTIERRGLRLTKNPSLDLLHSLSIFFSSKLPHSRISELEIAFDFHSDDLNIRKQLLSFLPSIVFLPLRRQSSSIVECNGISTYYGCEKTYKDNYDEEIEVSKHKVVDRNIILYDTGLVPNRTNGDSVRLELYFRRPYLHRSLGIDSLASFPSIFSFPLSKFLQFKKLDTEKLFRFLYGREIDEKLKKIEKSSSTRKKLRGANLIGDYVLKFENLLENDFLMKNIDNLKNKGMLQKQINRFLLPTESELFDCLNIVFKKEGERVSEKFIKMEE